MTSHAGFEESINEFVFSKTGEKVYLDLATEGTVLLRPLCKRGSVPLGAFWVHVFQHPNNYPVYSYPYKDLYRAGRKYELQLRVDGINVSINLSAGKLFLRGTHCIDWFVSRFPGIMEGYCSAPCLGSKELREQYTQEQMEALQQERQKMYMHYLEEWPLAALEKTAKVMEAGRKECGDYHEPINAEGFLMGEDLESYSPLSDLMDKEETVGQLERLEAGHVVQGCVLYRLWKSLLNLWFSDGEARVFIVTPEMDCDRLTDICTLFLTHKLTACVDTMCVPMNKLCGRFADVKKAAIKKYPPRDQAFIEYKIYSSIIYPISDFTSSFVAMVKCGEAHILQVNSNFDRGNFLSTISSTVSYKKIEEAHFVECYLDPIFK